MQYILMILKKKRKLSHPAPYFLSISAEYKLTERIELQDARSEQVTQTLGVSKHLIKSHEFPCTGVATHMERVSELNFSDIRPEITKVGLFLHRTSGKPQSAFVYSSSYYDCSHESILLATVHSLEFP